MRSLFSLRKVVVYVVAAVSAVVCATSFVSANSDVTDGVPYTKQMVISAYYSPLPDQAKYATGSYEGDIRLNGNGTNGADGTPVYPGMIAAPKNYPFGFKMQIPGIGLVAVHDRGGAIKNNRLDVWMGYGDAGLQRALNWGKRTLNVEMLGVNKEIKESVYLDGYYEAEKFVQHTVAINRMFPRDIWYQSSGKDVKKLQESLVKLGYDIDVSGFYGDETLEAIYELQVANGIVESWDELGAGHVGVQTRSTLERLLRSGGKVISVRDESVKYVHFPRGLARGDQGEDVKKLQEELVKMGFLRIEPTGVYDELTEHAVFKFQQKREILSEKTDFGAGVFGPKTRAHMNSVLTSRVKTRKLVAAKKAQKLQQIAPGKFLVDLEVGTRGDQVAYLQKTLQSLGYFKGSVTDYYGEQTEKALLAFQMDKGIVEANTDLGAGRLGPKTRRSLNSLINA